MAGLRDDFERAMFAIYERAKSDAGYNATRFLRMLQEHGGLETTNRLLPQMSDGFADLWKRNRLDLTVEALVVQAQWAPLFTARQVELARRRLADAGYAEA